MGMIFICDKCGKRSTDAKFIIDCTVVTDRRIEGLDDLGLGELCLPRARAMMQAIQRWNDATSKNEDR